MPSIVYCLLVLFFTNILFEPTTCALPEYLQSIELDDITSLWDKFPSIIGQIKQAVNRFRCPKGWRRLGGSCYYLSNLTSTPFEANDTCNQLHSNHSNLMQIRNTVELFYAAHVLTKYNLSALMVELDSNLLKGKTMTDILLEDQGRWQRMKEKFREIRIRYYKIKDKVLRELESAGLRISQRSRKIKQTVKRKKQKYFDDQNEMYDDYDYIENAINRTNDTIEIDEYEYENLDEEDDDNEFERMDDISGICDQIDWNVLDSNTTVYMLTTFLIDDKIVCSISNVEQDLEYEHLCEYVLDFCFANVICGKHGRCVNTLSGFKCSCSFLYGGILCEKISRQGKQIIIGIVIILFFYSLSFKPIRWLLTMCVTGIIDCFKLRKKRNQWKKAQKEKDDQQQLVNEKKTEESSNINERRATIAEDLMDFIFPKHQSSVKNPNKRDLSRLFWVGGLVIFFLTLLLSLTTITHFSSFKYGVVNHTEIENLLNDTVRLVAKCGSISNYRKENVLFFPIAVAMIFVFSWSIKREKKCLNMCDARPGLIPPIEPFRTANRLTTATVFGILAFEVLKIFEELLFASADPFNRGILIELLERIILIILIGLRYYPVLASLQLRNIAVRFFAFIYMVANIIYTIIRESACMGYLPLAKYYAPLEEAKLRMELGTWFIVYGLVKNTPHFGLLSYITAELCVRFFYDSIYVPCKKKKSIWLAPIAQPDEADFAKFYVTRLFRRNVHTVRKANHDDVDIDDLIDYEHIIRLQQKRKKPSKIKKYLNDIYTWNDDFRFTTIATCTYTVAVVFLYYLACTLVFLYTSRTAGHISFIRHYIESTLNIEFKGFFSLRSTIFWSALITFVLFLYQLFLGMKNYKKHKLQLYRGIYEDVPSAQNFKANSMAAKSVHYSGFLVGYMAWGFVICFHLIFFIMILLRIVSLQIRYFEIILAFTVPVLVVYLLKMVTISSAGKFFFIQEADEKLNLKNRKIYAIFVYFNFFADCFLGIASCIIRLCKAMFLNIVYMARLDCSFLGRPLERLDLGFAAYVSYLHMEVTHTNPIMLAFCYSLYEDVVKRRSKHCYDDECCIAPGELNDDDDYEIVVEKKTSPTKKSQVAPEKKSEPVKKVEEDDDDDDDDDDGLSVKEEIKPKAKSKSPSITPDRISQRSKPKKSSIDDDRSKPVISTIARLIPEEQPRLPPISPEPPPPPKRADLPSEKEDDDDEDDDDGGVKPATTSTIETIIPREAPRLLPIQRSSPPPSPPRSDEKDDDDDDDDDGGMASRKSTPPKNKPAEKKKKKNQVEKDDNDDEDEDDDDDGGVKPPSISTISKIMPKQPPHLSPFHNASAPPRPSPPKVPQRQDLSPDENDDDDEDDGGIDPKVIAKQKQEADKKKKKKEQEMKKKKQIADDDDGFDNDGGVNPKTKKPKEKKTNKSKVPLIFEDEDDDGGVSKEKRQAEQKKKKELEEKKKQKEQLKKKAQKENDDDDDDGAAKGFQSNKKSKSIEKKKSPKSEFVKEEDEDDDGGRIVKTYDTIRTIMPSKQPVLDRQSKSASKTPSPGKTDDGSMSTSRIQREPLLKSVNIVGRMASPPLNEESHYDTIPTDEERAARSQAIYSPPSYTKVTTDINESFPLRSTSYREAQQTEPSTRKKSSIRSQSTINEDSSHYSEITNETASSGIINRSYSHAGSIRSASNHSIKPQSKQSSQHTLKQEQQTEESQIESEEEDEKKEEEKKKFVKKKTLEPLPNISTAHQTLNYLVKPNEASKIQEVAKKRVARFRWFLAYTIINNYHLFDLRKQAQSRLARLRISRSNLYDEEKHAATAAAVPVVEPEPSELRERKTKVAPPSPRHLLSVPVPVVDDFPQSPAERYVAIRSAMLYDASAQQSDVSRSQAASTASPQVRFKNTPAVIIHSPSETSTKRKRPSYQRQETEVSNPFLIEQHGGTPTFQGIPESVQSTADYPLTNGSSATNFSTLRTQMSHAQHMQAWKCDQLKRIQKKQPYCYHYGAPLQRPMEEKIATAAILTPQIIESHRSPFLYPRQVPPTNEKQRNKTQSSSSTTTNTDNNNKQDPSTKKKSIRATSSLVHRKDSQNSFSNATEV